MNWLNKALPVGSRSLLFGVHQFLWHPITVARAWRYLYGKWPNLHEAVCIFCHDLGYWGSPNMDGAEGKRHPEAGAQIAARWVGRLSRLTHWVCLPLVLLLTGVGRRSIKRMSREREFKFYFHQIRGCIGARATHAAVNAHFLVLFHSRSYVRLHSAPVSKLCGADKLSVAFDPFWWYVLRAWLSGEGEEFRRNAVDSIGLQPLPVWADWYRNKIKKQYEKTLPSGARSLSDI